MIEIICNGKNDNKSISKNDENPDDKSGMTYSCKANAIRRPKNIKQIGDVSSDRKIYIEDYAFTYINSVAFGMTDEEQAGVLLGECQKNSDEKCIFIKGVIRANRVDKTDSSETSGIHFDENVWSRIYSDIEKYFPNLQVVGWFAAMPVINQERMQFLKKIHIDNFSGNMKTMYLINSTERESAFYLYENGGLKKQSGYVCFYERNYEMQEYMLQKRGHRSTELPGTDRVMKSIRTVIKENEEQKQQRKNTVFMYGVSTLMVMVVLVIGINIINSYEKMKRFDNSLSTIALEISNMNSSNIHQESTDSEIVPVNQLAGNVYPTTAEQTPVAQLESETKSETVSETPSETAILEDNTLAFAEASIEAAKEYVVESGDTLMSICKKNYGSASKYKDVMECNDLTDPNKLYVGQVIKLP